MGCWLLQLLLWMVVGETQKQKKKEKKNNERKASSSSCALSEDVPSPRQTELYTVELSPWQRTKIYSWRKSGHCWKVPNYMNLWSVCLIDKSPDIFLGSRTILKPPPKNFPGRRKAVELSIALLLFVIVPCLRELLWEALPYCGILVECAGRGKILGREVK